MCNTLKFEYRREYIEGMYLVNEGERELSAGPSTENKNIFAPEADTLKRVNYCALSKHSTREQIKSQDTIKVLTLSLFSSGGNETQYYVLCQDRD